MLLQFVDLSSLEKPENSIELIDIMATPADVVHVYKHPTQSL